MNYRLLQYMEDILREVDASIIKFLKKHNVNCSVNDFKTLLHIAALRETNKNNASEIANHFNITPSAVSIVLKTLEGKSFLYRYHNQDDRRKVFIGLTKTTLELLDKYKVYQKKLMNQLSKSIHAVDYKDLVTTLLIIKNNLKGF